MEKYTGKSVLKGIAIGRIYWYQKQDYQVIKTEVEERGRKAQVFPGSGNRPGTIVQSL